MPVAPGMGPMGCCTLSPTDSSRICCVGAALRDNRVIKQCWIRSAATPAFAESGPEPGQDL